MGTQFKELIAAGKTDQAISVAEKIVVADRQVMAIPASSKSEKKIKREVDREAIETLVWLIRAHLHSEAWLAAAERQGELADITDEVLGKTNCYSVDLRNDQVYYRRLASLKPEETRALVRVDATLATISEAHATGKYAEAIPLLQEAVKVQQQFLGNSSPKVADSLNGLAYLYQAQRDYARAEPLCRQVLVIRKKVLGENHLAYVSSLNNLASVYKAQDDYARAEPLCRQVLEIRKKVLGENHPNYADSLHALAELYQRQGDYARAEPLYRQAVEIAKKVFGENHPNYSAGLNNLAFLYELQGDYARAEPLYRQTVEIAKKVFGENHPNYGKCLNNLATLYLAQGDNARAEPLFQKAHEITKKALGENHPDCAIILDTLAGLYHDDARAERIYLQSLEIYKKAVGEKHPLYAISLERLASMYVAQGQYARAEPLFQKALEIVKKALGEDHPNYASSLGHLAGLYRAQGDYARAEPLFRQALEIRKKVLGENHPYYASSLNDLAKLYQAQADYARAEPLVRQGAAIIRRHIEATSIVQSERQQLAMLQDNRECLDQYLNLAAGSGRFAAAVYAESLAWKGIVLRRNRLARAGTQSPELAETFTQLQRVTTQLTRLAWAMPDPKQEANWRERTAKLSAEKEELEAQLSAHSAEYRRAKRQVTLEEVQTALPQDAVLIDFVEYTHFTPADKKAGTKKAGERRLLSFILATGRSAELVPLGVVQPINEAIEAWRVSCGTSADGTKAARLLRERLWEPIEGKLHGAKVVFLSPDGVLSRLPFAALPGKAPGSYLIEEHTFAVVPVPQLIPELACEDGRKQLQKNLLLMGNVDYDADVRSTGFNQNPDQQPPGRHVPMVVVGGTASKTLHFGPLPGTEGEVVAIERLYRADVGGDGVTTLKKSEASKQAFLAEARRNGYLHLATHGFFLEEKLPEPMGFATREAGRFGDQLHRSEAAAMHPSLLSGLALAGANHTGQADVSEAAGNSGGIVTAEEIGTQNLDGVQLVVLSACETGLGKAAGGEGLLGLQRAFQSAGARTVVASLWSVDDQGTRVLMEEFYKNLWEKKMPKLEALRQAQLKMLRNYDAQAGQVRGLGKFSKIDPDILAHAKEVKAGQAQPLSPAYWAAFVLSGDWR